MGFSLTDIDFVFGAIEDVWDNTPNVEDLPVNATHWRKIGDEVVKTDGQIVVAVNVKTRTVEIRQPFASQDHVSNRDRITIL